MIKLYENAIYKDAGGDCYKTVRIAYSFHGQNAIVVYHSCNEHGIFKKLMRVQATDRFGHTVSYDIEKSIPQPLWLDYDTFANNLTFYKQL